MRAPLACWLLAVFAVSVLAAPATAFARSDADKSADKSRLKTETFSALEFRSIGPALTSGRIVDLAVTPGDKSTWYVASAYGGLWKTSNAGTTCSFSCGPHPSPRAKG